MYECPECGQKPFLGNTVYSNEWQCACMNACCHNMSVAVHKNPFMSIHEWNIRYGRKRCLDEDNQRTVESRSM